MLILPVSDGVPSTLRYPICSIPAEIVARSSGARRRLPDGAGVPSEIERVRVVGPSTTVPDAPGVVAVIATPLNRNIESARITISPAAGGEEEVLLTVPSFRKVPPEPPAISVIGPPDVDTKPENGM